MKSLNSKHFWLLIIFSTLWVVSFQFGGKITPTTTDQQTEKTTIYPEQRLLKGEKIDLNRASARELRALPGVGPKLAAQIVRDRAKKGPFPTPESLVRVKGIGPKKLAKIRPLLIVSQKLER